MFIMHHPEFWNSIRHYYLYVKILGMGLLACIVHPCLLGVFTQTSCALPTQGKCRYHRITLNICIRKSTRTKIIIVHISLIGNFFKQCILHCVVSQGKMIPHLPSIFDILIQKDVCIVLQCQKKQGGTNHVTYVFMRENNRNQ